MDHLSIEEWTDENKILIGVLQTIKNNQKTPILHETVFNALERYKQEYINRGIAYGGLEVEIQESTENEYQGDGNIDKLLQNAFAEHASEYNKADEVTQLSDAAFRVVHADYDPERREILGRIEILNTDIGFEVQRRISNGMKPFISQGGVEGSVEPVNVKAGNLRLCYKVVKILPTYMIAFIRADENFKTLKYTEMGDSEVENPDDKFNEKINTNLDDDAKQIFGNDN